MSTTHQKKNLSAAFVTPELRHQHLKKNNGIISRSSIQIHIALLPYFQDKAIVALHLNSLLKRVKYNKLDNERETKGGDWCLSIAGYSLTT